MQFLRIRATWITFEPLILQPVKVGENGDPYSGPTPGQQIQWSKKMTSPPKNKKIYKKNKNKIKKIVR